MTQPQNSADMLQQVAERIARVVRVVWQIILALALAITLILKVYMLVLTDHQCVGDAVTLGNTIRCTPVLELLAYVLALSAGFDLAYRLCLGPLEEVTVPIALSLGAALLFVLAGMAGQSAGWREALIVVALTASMAGLLWLSGRKPQADKPDDP